MNAEKSGQQVLFVCTGNSCRSVMANYLLLELLPPHLKERFRVVSAGTAALPGAPPTGETVEAMREVDIDITSHQARALTASLVGESDVIITMGRSHRESVLGLCPLPRKEVFLLSYFGGDGKKEIADPLGRSLTQYRRCREQIRKYLVKLVQALIEREGKEE